MNNNETTFKKFIDDLIKILKDALDPQYILLESFDLDDYCNVFLNNIGKTFGTPLIILRKREENGEFRVVAIHDNTEDEHLRLTKADAEKVKVYLSSPVVRHLNTASFINGLEDAYLIKDLQDKGSPDFPHKAWAEEHSLRSALFVPLVVEKENEKSLEGFVAFHKRQIDGFEDATQRNKIVTLGKLIGNIFQFAFSYSSIGKQYMVLHGIIENEKESDKFPSIRDRAYCKNYLAKYCLKQFEWSEAGKNFHQAAEGMLVVSPLKSLKHSSKKKDAEFIIENLAESAVAHARGCDILAFCKSRDRFLEVVKNIDLSATAEFYFKKIINVAEESGYSQESSNTYIKLCKLKKFRHFFTIDRRLKHTLLIVFVPVKFIFSGLRYVFFKLWGLTSKYGESFPRWIFYCLLTIVIFTIKYWPYLAAYALNGENNAGLYINPNHICTFSSCTGFCLKTFISSFYFSTVVSTTLGFGDIFPNTDIPKVIVTINVMAGYFLFGVLVTLVSRKMVRK